MGISLARRHDSFREPVVQPCLPTPENLMFYEAQANKHGLKHDPFKALVVPRPIGWISTVGCDGVLNLAPYSFFNAVSTDPHIVMFASAGRKDSQRNAEEAGEFVCNLAGRSEEHTSELQSLMRISYAVFCLKNNKKS